MKDNFDMKKFLAENKLGAYSRLKEESNKNNIDEATIKDLIDPLVKKLESMGYETDIDPTGGYKTLFAWKVMPDKSSLTVFVGPSDDELAKRDYKGFDNFETIDVSFNYYTTKVTKKFFGLYKSKERVGQHLSDENKEGQNIDLGRGMFDIPIEDSVNRVADLVKKAEQKATGGQIQEDEDLAKADEIDKVEEAFGGINENDDIFNGGYSVSDTHYNRMDQLVNDRDYTQFITAATNIMRDLDEEGFDTKDIFYYLYTRLTADV